MTDGKKGYVVAVWFEDEGQIECFATLEEAEAFRRGVRLGADTFSGSQSTWLLNDNAQLSELFELSVVSDMINGMMRKRNIAIHPRFDRIES